jgi:hypothetical protein
MLALPGKKHLMPLIKIKVVEETKSLIQGGPRRRHICCKRGAKQGYEADNSGKHRTPY